MKYDVRRESRLPVFIPVEEEEEPLEKRNIQFSWRNALKGFCAYFLGRYGERGSIAHFSVVHSFVYQMNSTFSGSYILQCINLSINYGGLVVLLIYITVSLVVSIPLGHIFSFLGSYSTKAHCRIWQIVPMLKGIGYSITILTILKTCIESTLSAVFLHMFTTTIFSNPWKDCYYRPLICPTQTIENQSCTGAFEFVPKVVFSPDSNHKEFTWKNGAFQFDWPYTLNLFWVWTILFIITSIKIQHEKFMVFVGCYLLAIGSFCFSLYFIFYSPDSQVISTKIEHLFSYKVWLDVAIFTIQNDLPFVWINLYYSKPYPEKFKGNIHVLVALKIFVVFVVICNIPYIVGSHRQMYQTNGCIFVSGYYLVISVLPVIFFRMNWHFGNIYYLWYCFISITSMVTTIRLLYVGIFDRFPVLYRIRNLIKLVYCAGSCCLAIVQVRFGLDVGLYVIQTKFINMSTTILFILTVFGLVIYGLRRIQGDYYFMVKKEFPGINNIKRLFFSMGIIFIWFCMDLWKHTSHEHIYFYAITGITCLPIILVFFLYISKNCKSSPKWGMSSALKKRERKLLNIYINSTYRKNLQCQHVCLRNDSQLLKEINS